MGCAHDIAQAKTQVAASVQYLVRIIITHHITDIEAIFSLLIFCFCVGRNECDPGGTGSLDRNANVSRDGVD